MRYYISFNIPEHYCSVLWQLEIGAMRAMYSLSKNNLSSVPILKYL